MDSVVLVSGAVVLVAAVSIYAIRNERRTGKKLGRGSAAAGLEVINELFQPSAANAALIIEEQREARKATPSPEDKGLDELIAEYVAGQNTDKSV